MHVRMYVRMYVRVHVCMCVSMRICMYYVCVCVCMYPTIGSSSVAFSDFSSAFPRHAGTQLTQESSSRRRCSAMLAEKTSSSSSGNRRSFCSRCFSALLATTTRSCSCKSSDFSALAETASGCSRTEKGQPQPHGGSAIAGPLAETIQSTYERGAVSRGQLGFQAPQGDGEAPGPRGR